MKKKGSGIMNKFIDSKASYVDLLIDKYNPPSNPKCVVDYDVKGIVESRLGVCLPEDYYEYINIYSYSYWWHCRCWFYFKYHTWNFWNYHLQNHTLS